MSEIVKIKSMIIKNAVFEVEDGVYTLISVGGIGTNPPLQDNRLNFSVKQNSGKLVLVS